MKGRQLILVLPLGLCLGLVLAMGNLVLSVRAEPVQAVIQTDPLATAAPTSSGDDQRTGQTSPLLITETEQFTPTNIVEGSVGAVTATNGVSATVLPAAGAVLTPADVVTTGLAPGAFLTDAAETAVLTAEVDAAGSPAATAALDSAQVLAVDPPPHDHTARVDTSLVATVSAVISPTSVNSGTFRVHGGFRGRLTGTLGLVSGGTILFDPDADLLTGELVEASATGGITAGGAALTPYLWRFRAAVGGGTGQLEDSGQSLGSADSYGVALGDVDGDGDLDAFVANNGANRVWRNDGNGGYSDSGQSLGSANSQGVALGDVDGDGDLDAFVANNGALGAPNAVWLNDGSGSFSPGGPGLGTADSRAVALGDVDGDGDLDAFVANDGANGVWLNDGSGGFSDSGQGLGALDSYDVALGDVDGDGDLDAFVANSSAQSNKVWLNAGGLQAGSLGTYQDSGQTLGNSRSEGVALGDLDGDGDLDALVANRSPQSNKVWRNNGAGGFSLGQDLGDTSDSTDVALGDLDGDGDLDALLANTGLFGGAANGVWRNNGQAAFADTGQRLGQSRSESVALGDLDGDGDLDALVANRSPQSNRAWLNGNRSDLAVVKSAGADEVLPGDRVSYTLVYANQGPQVASDVVITDMVPFPMMQVSYTSSGPVVTPVGPVPYTWQVQDLEPGDVGVITLTGIISPGVASSIVFTNAAEIGSAAADPQPGDNRSEAGVRVVIPDLFLVKTAAPALGVEYHSLVTYTIAVANGGNGPARNVTLTDTLPLEVEFARWVPGGQPAGAGLSPENDQITWTGNVEAGEAVTFTFRVTHVGGYGDLVTNTATFSHRFGSGSDDATFAVIAPPALSIAKEVTPAVDIPYHSEVTYTLVLSNGGVADAHGTVLTDRLPAGADFARWAPGGQPAGAVEEAGVIRWAGTVAVGEPLTFTFVVTHDGDYADLVTNVVSYGHVSGSGADSATFNVIAPPALVLGKEVTPDTDIPYHSEVSYTLVLSNEGVADAYGTVLTDALPAGVAFGRWVAGGRPVGAVEEAGGVVHWTGTVTSGEAMTFAFVVTHTGGYGDVVLNVAEYDHASGSGSAGATFSVVGPPDLRLRKTAVPGTDVAFHGEVTYTIVVSNAGELDAADVRLTDTLRAEVAFGRWLEQPPGAVESGGTITWTGPLPVGEALAFTFVVTHTGAYGDLVVNEAELGHWSGDTAGEATFAVIGPPDLVIEKRSSAGQVLPGDAVTFTLAYANQGPEVASGVLISDRIPASLTGVRFDHSGPAITPTGQVSYAWQVEDLPPGNGGLITISAVVSAGLPAGVITNVATITHALPEGDAGDNRSEVAVRVVVPDLSIDKRVQPEVDVVHHSQVTYTVVLSNSGDGDARGVVLTDLLPPEVEFVGWIPGAAPPGGTVSDGEIGWTGRVTAGEALTLTFLARHVGQHGDVVTNVAAYDYPFGSGSDGATFAVLPPPDLYLTKTSRPDAAVLPGDLVTFTLEYGNSGPSVAYDVVISDLLPSSIAQASYVSTGTLVTAAGGVSYTWLVEDLVPGAGGAITVSAVLSQPLPAGRVTNTAEITSSTPDADGADNRARAAVRVVVPDLAIEKTVRPEVDVAYHGEVTYTIVTSNGGEGDAEGVVISDLLPSLVEFRRWAAGGQPPGASQSGGEVNWSGTFAPGEAVTLAFLAGHVGTYGDVVTNTSMYRHWSGSGSDEAIFAVIGPPELGIRKWVSAETSVAYHAEVTYTVVLSNGGAADAHETVLTDRLPAEVEFERWVSGGKPAGAFQAGQQITWTGTVTASQAVTLAYVARHAGYYEDVVTNEVSYQHVSGSDSSEATFTVIGPPALSVVKEVTPAVDVPYQGEVTYTLVLSNGGAADAHGTVLTDRMPTGVDFARWAPGGQPAGAVEEAGVVRWVGTVEVGEPVTFTFVVTHDGDYADLVTNVVSYGHVSGSGADSATFSVIAPPELALRKEVTPDTDVPYHSEVTYTLVLSNEGVADAYGTVLTDELPAGVEFGRWVAGGRPVGAVEEAGGVVRWTGTVTSGEALTFAFVVTHTGGYGDVVLNTAQYDHASGSGSAGAATSVVGPPDLRLHKTAVPDMDVAFLGEVTYTIVLSNGGVPDAEGLVLADRLPGLVEFDRWVQQPADADLAEREVTWAGTLAAGEAISLSFVVSHTGTYGDVVTNTAAYAHVSGLGDDSAAFSVIGPPDLALVKAVNPPYLLPGAALTYTIAYSNRGATTASAVTLVDEVPLSLRQVISASSGARITATAGLSYSWVVEDLSPGEGGAITISGVVSEGLPYGAVLTNSAFITHALPEGDPGDNRSAVRVKVRERLARVQPRANVHTATLTTHLTATTDGPVDGGSVTAETFRVHGQFHGRLGGSYAAALPGCAGCAVFYPAEALFPGEAVEASVTEGVVVDSAPLVAHVWQFRTAVAHGIGRFTENGQTLGGADSQDVALGDLDGDGDIDAFVANNGGQGNRVWLSDGRGRLVDSGQSLGSASSWGAALADADGDGDLDLFVANTLSNTVWLNDGTGAFSAGGQALGNADSRDVALGDLDGDGDLDAYFANQDGANEIWVNDGTGSFQAGDANLEAGTSWAVALGDLDADGDLDAFVANSGANRVWLNDGQAAFTSSGPGLGAAGSRGMALGDLDGDGDLDAFVGNEGVLGAPNAVWLNDGHAGFSDSGQGLGGSSCLGVALGDLDGDGDLDAFAANTGAGGALNQVWVNDGSGVFGASAQDLGVLDTSRAVAVGDVDRDGDLDALVANAGSNRLWLNGSRADLALAKTVTPVVASPGQTVTYTLAYTNHGPQVARAVVITDLVPMSVTNVSYASSGAALTPTGAASYTWEVGDLWPGMGGVITVTGVTSPDLSAGELFTNTAVITAGVEDGHLTDNESQVTVTIGMPALSITKAVTPQDLLYHREVTYTVVVSNSGDGDGVGVVLTDRLPALVAFERWVQRPAGAREQGGEIAWTGAVKAGGALPFSFVVRHTGDFADVVTNSVHFDHWTGSGGHEATFTVIDPPQLAVAKHAVPELDVQYRGEVTYTVVLSNAGAADAEGTVLTDELPAGVEFAAWVLGGRPPGTTRSEDEIRWTGTVTSGEALRLQYVARHTGAYSDRVTNTVEYSHAIGTGWDQATFQVVGPPQLSIAKHATPEADVGYHAPVTYTVVLANGGPVDAEGVVLTDTLPAYVAFDHWPPGGRPDAAVEAGNTITWTGLVRAGGAVTLTFVVSHVGDYRDVVTNTAVYSHFTSQGRDDAVFAVAGPPDLALDKSAIPDQLLPGEEVRFVLDFANKGPSTAHGVVISDVVPVAVTELSYKAEPGLAITPTGAVSYTWAVEDLEPDRGGVITITGIVAPETAAGIAISNTAQITAATPDEDSADNEAGVTVTVLGRVLQVTPPANAHTASLDTDLTATLSGIPSAGSVTAETFRVHGGLHGRLAGTLTVGAGANRIVFDPAGDLFPGEQVEATASDGVLIGDAHLVPYVWRFRAGVDAGSGEFGLNAHGLFGGRDSNAVTLGDLDGDGDLDAVVANLNAQPQEVWLNDGEGRFGSSAHDAFGAGESTGVALGDLDGDGDLDAVVANLNGQPQEVWLNDGSGDFGPLAHDTFGGGWSTSVAMGDVDGDGDLDAVVANMNAAPQEIWLNDGAGRFGPSAHEFFGGGESTCVALGDLDADGDLDAMVANYWLGAQEVWLNDGDGDMTAGDTFGAGLSWSLALGDLDGDGDLDAVVASDGGQPQEVWLNDGSGIFGAGDTFGGSHGRSIALGDLDGDGDLDAVVANEYSQAQEVWLGDGAGNFGAAPRQTFSGGWSRSVALGDVDGDGDLDAVIANAFGEAEEVWLNQDWVVDVEPAPNTHTAPLATDLVVTTSSAVRPASITTRTISVHGGFHGDISGVSTIGSGGRTVVHKPVRDLIPGERVQATVISDAVDYPYVWEFRAAALGGSGKFGAAAHDTFGSGYSTAVAWGDLDADGDLDVVVANNYSRTQKVWLNDGAGGFGTTAHDTFGGGWSTSLALGDVDGDGDLDAVVANDIDQAQEVWLNEGTGNFGVAAHHVFGAGDSTSVALGDLNGDGDLDAVVANRNGQPQEVWLNDGTGQYGAGAHDSFGGGYSTSVALGDVDMDGDVDAIVANDNGEAQEVWLNDGTGDFGAAPHDTFGAGYTKSLALGDLDGDGDLDAVIANDYLLPEQVWLNDGNGNYGLAAHQSFGSPGVFIVLADLDADGDLDAVLVNKGRAQEVWRNDGTGSFGLAAHDTFGGGYSTYVAPGDADGDGDLDLLVANFDRPQDVWLNQDGADLRLHKSVTPSGDLAPGDPLAYTLVYSNAGPQTALGVVITDRVPVSVTGVHYESGGADLVSVGSTPYTWQVADLEPGDGGAITITGLLSQPLTAGPFTNTALIATTLVDNAPEDNSSAAMVTVANIAPVAVDDDYAISATISLTVPAPGVLGNDSDHNGDPLASHLLAAPLSGTLDLNTDGSFSYTPTLGLDGVVTFTYLASDGTLTGTATVSLDARADNQLPTISSIPDQRTKVGVPVGPIAFTVDDEETDPGDLTVSAGSSNPLLVDVAHIVLGGSGANRLVTVEPQAGITGTAVITLTVSDGAADARTAFRLTVENYRSYLPVILRD